MEWLTILGLCIAGLLAVVVELFVPAAGLIGVLGVGSMTAGVVLSFVRYGARVGTAFLVGVLLVTPGVMVLYFRLFPGSFVGRWLILRGTQRAEDGFSSHDKELYDSLSGSEGIAVTPLRPSGTAEIAGRRYSVVTAGEFLERGDRVRVTRTEGSRIVVMKGA